MHRIVDSSGKNPAFAGDLKVICKKEPSFRHIYDNEVKPFCIAVLETGCDAATTDSRFNEVIKDATVYSKQKAYEIIKFRARFENKGSRESPRMFVAVLRIQNMIIPLMAYTHGIKKVEPQMKDILTRLKAALEKNPVLPQGQPSGEIPE